MGIIQQNPLLISDIWTFLPKQVISVAASLIPFLEHDDANRALMGFKHAETGCTSGFPETPRCCTGMEGKTAYDSGVLVKAKEIWCRRYVSSDKVIVRPDFCCYRR